MIAGAILNEARAAGVTLWVEAGALRYRGPREAVVKLLPALKANKPALLAALGEAADLKTFFRDMAAILETLADLPKPEAEVEAARITSALARNRGYLWASLRAALGECPALLAQVPLRKSGPVDELPWGVAKLAVLKSGRALRQGTFSGAPEVKT